MRRRPLLAKVLGLQRYDEPIEMLAKSPMSIEEYLALEFPDRPEADYVDGEVVERALPTPIHSQIQAQLAILFAPLQKQVRLVTMSELRVPIEPRRFRVIDFAVYRDRRPEGRYATEPAFIAIEIVSPDGNYHNLTQRLEDYRCWGASRLARRSLA